MSLWTSIRNIITKPLKLLQDWLLPSLEDNRGILIEKSGTNNAYPIVYGTTTAPAVKIFKMVSDKKGGAKNEYLNLVCVFCEGEVDAIEEIFFNDIPSAQISSERYYIEKYTGSDNQTYSAKLGAEISAWKSTATLSGLCYAYIRLKINKKLDWWQGEPQIKARIRGRKVNDIRTNTVAYSENPALILLDYLTNTRFGKGGLQGDFDLDSFKVAADYCDIGESYTQTTYRYVYDQESGRVIQMPSGTTTVTTPRMSCNILMSTTKKVLDNVKELRSGCRGLLIPSAQGFKFLIEQGGLPVYHFDENNLRKGKVDSQAGDKDSYHNSVTVRYPSKLLNGQYDEVTWPKKDDPLLTTWLSEDNNIPLDRSYDFPTINNKAEALQMAEVVCRRSRETRTIKLLGQPWTIGVELADIVTLDDTTHGYVGKAFRIVDKTINIDGSIDFDAIVHQDSIYPWSVTDVNEYYPDTSLALPSDISAPTGLAFTEYAESETKQGKLTWDDPNNALISGFHGEIYDNNVLIASFTTLTNQFDIDGLEIGTYQLRLSSKNSLYYSAESLLNFTISEPFTSYRRFDDATFNDGLKKWTGTVNGKNVRKLLSGSNLNIVTTGEFGGNSLSVKGGFAAYWRDAIAINVNKKYRVRFRVRQTVDPTTGGSSVYAGVACLNANFQNSVEGVGTHRYCAAHGQTITVSNGWQEFEGIITGIANSANAFKSYTVYIRPMFIVNYNGGNGTAEVDYLTIEEVPDSELIKIGANWVTLPADGADVTNYKDIRISNAVAQAAAAADAQAKANLAKTQAQAYADGIVTAEEQRAINDAQAKANLAETTAKAYSDGIVNAEEVRAIADAQAKADLAKTIAQAYADGIVTTAEANAIAQAQTKADAAQAAAISAAATDAQAKANTAQANAISTAATAAQAKADLAQTTAQAYSDGIVTAAEANAIAQAQTKADAAQAAAISAAATDAQAKADLAETTSKAYADGIVTAEEQRAIDDAQAKADLAEANAKNYVNTQLTSYVTDSLYANEKAALQAQIDKAITTWFVDGMPTLTNEPAINWTTTDDKNTHLGDLYYDNLTGYAYRFMINVSVYSWTKVSDSDVTKALADAAKAQDTADGKRRVFVAQPIPPYDVGDLWDAGGVINRCSTAKAIGAVFTIGDWLKVSDTTDYASDLISNSAVTLDSRGNLIGAGGGQIDLVNSDTVEGGLVAFGTAKYASSPGVNGEFISDVNATGGLARALWSGWTSNCYLSNPQGTPAVGGLVPGNQYRLVVRARIIGSLTSAKFWVYNSTQSSYPKGATSLTLSNSYSVIDCGVLTHNWSLNDRVYIVWMDGAGVSATNDINNCMVIDWMAILPIDAGLSNVDNTSDAQTQETTRQAFLVDDGLSNNKIKNTHLFGTDKPWQVAPASGADITNYVDKRIHNSRFSMTDDGYMSWLDENDLSVNLGRVSIDGLGYSGDLDADKTNYGDSRVVNTAIMLDSRGNLVGAGGGKIDLVNADTVEGGLVTYGSGKYANNPGSNGALISDVNASGGVAMAIWQGWSAHVYLSNSSNTPNVGGFIPGRSYRLFARARVIGTLNSMKMAFYNSSQGGYVRGNANIQPYLSTNYKVIDLGVFTHNWNVGDNVYCPWGSTNNSSTKDINNCMVLDWVAFLPVDDVASQQYMPNLVSAGAGTALNVNPLSASDNGSTAKITVASHTRQYGFGILSLNAGSITGLSFSTKYYVYYDDSTYTGGAVSYQATTNLQTIAAGNNRIFVSSITTPADGGGTTSPPPEYCVCLDMWLTPLLQAEFVKQGDELDLWWRGTDAIKGKVKQAKKLEQKQVIYEIETSSGAIVRISESTPLELQDHTIITPKTLITHQDKLATLKSGDQTLHWELVTRCEIIGEQEVMHISVGNGSFAAGLDANNRIITHNAQIKP